MSQGSADDAEYVASLKEHSNAYFGEPFLDTKIKRKPA